MASSNKIAGIIFGAAIGVALVRYFAMSQEEKDRFLSHVKNKTSELLDNAEETVEKVEHFMEEFNSKPGSQWIDKLYTVKKMFNNLYGSEKNYLL